VEIESRAEGSVQAGILCLIPSGVPRVHHRGLSETEQFGYQPVEQIRSLYKLVEVEQEITPDSESVSNSGAISLSKTTAGAPLGL
jgi:hypothetical protein